MCTWRKGRTLELVLLPNPETAYQPKPPRWFHPAWMYCTVRNDTDESIFVYGARHESETTTIPTSLYLLPPKQRTPHFWDCKGVLIPMGREVRIKGQVIQGPVALKYRDFRWVRMRRIEDAYLCPPHNGVLTAEQMDFPAPLLSHEQLLACPRRVVRVR